MTHLCNYNYPENLAKTLKQQGLGALPEMTKNLGNNAMRQERNKYLHAGEFEPTEKRKEFTNRFKSKMRRPE